MLPSARAGHVASAVSTRGGGWQVYLFGGGNSTSGFDDLHVLRPNMKWKALSSATAPTAPNAQPTPTEGAAMAHSGGMLLLFGGYTSTGATRNAYAWGCEAHADNACHVAAAVDATSALGGGAAPRGGGVALSPKGSEPIVLMACPAGAKAQRHAQAAQAAFGEKLGGAHVVATPAEDGGVGAQSDVSEASTNEQALSLMLQRLHKLQLEQKAFGPSSSASLLSRARVLCAVQPCVYQLMAGGAPRTFVCFWVGLADPTTGRTHVGSSLSREVAADEMGWGKAARSPAEINEDAAAVLLQAWRSLMRAF